MQIEFFDLLAAEGWEPIAFAQFDPNFRWGGDGPLVDAPIDLAATLDGGMWQSTRVDQDFNMGGKRCKPGLTVPWHSLNLRQLILVMGGEFAVESAEGESRTVKAGDFWISEANVKQTMTAGPEGVTYVDTWPVWVQLYTTWYDDDHWVKR